MARGTNTEETRAYNRRAILQTLHRAGASSRTELARQTSLSLQAVSNIVQALEADGLVVSQGRRSTGRGQPPFEYAINARGSFSLGVSVDLDHASGVLVDAAGGVLAARHLQLDARDPHRTLESLAALVDELRVELPVADRRRLSGVALGVPGVVEAKGGTIARMVRLDRWEGLSVGDLLSKRLGSPVLVANDAILAALGERWFGVAREWDNFFYVLFSLGMGSSLILGGEPYGGPWGHRGRLGHIPVEPGGLPCPSCGGSGCLSLYTSMGALEDHLLDHGVEVAGQGGLVELWQGRHPSLREWLDEATHYLARGLVVLENLLAPEAIVFGGRMPRPILEDLVSGAGELYQQQRTPLRPQPARLLLGRDDADVVTIGAAALPHYLATAANYQLVQSR